MVGSGGPVGIPLAEVLSWRSTKTFTRSSIPGLVNSYGKMIDPTKAANRVTVERVEEAMKDLCSDKYNAVGGFTATEVSKKLRQAHEDLCLCKVSDIRREVQAILERSQIDRGRYIKGLTYNRYLLLEPEE